MSRNDQANLQSTLNKGAGGASGTIFVTDCSFKDADTSEISDMKTNSISLFHNQLRKGTFEKYKIYAK